MRGFVGCGEQVYGAVCHAAAAYGVRAIVGPSMSILTRYSMMCSGTPCLYQAMRIRFLLTESKARDLSQEERCRCWLAS